MPQSKRSREVRAAFLDYFKRQGHEIVRSSALVPDNDPTLLFANAGMNQFKDVFTGREARPYKRATTSQKCVRAGGKHNDLENVGFTARHHTFFEMLGNFSFGDYFKAEAIEWAYGLMVKELGLDPKRMMYTVFGGDKSLPTLGPDDEARALWRKVTGVGDDRVMGLGAKDNFWQMGDVGPMGPCSEIHYFQGDHIPCPEPKCLGPACDCDRWLEIWNLVFMQYERREKDGPLGKLPAPSVDTGAGLERMTSVVNGLENNYDTDLFTPIIATIERLSGKQAGKDAADTASMRVIADHARTTAFLIADGVFPDKTGREYVLRRIFRRAVRHGQRLGLEDNFMHLACAVVRDEMKDVYPELKERWKTIETVVVEEETRFRKTLHRGLGLLEDEFVRMKKAGETMVPGAKVFQLYDTFGFPADLTAVIAAERGLGADQAGFEKEMKAAQERSEFQGGTGVAVADVVKELERDVPASTFQGYEGRGTSGEGKILALVVDGKRVDSARDGQDVWVVADKTPFYGESGGQCGDAGVITGPKGSIAVSDAQKGGGLTIHAGRVSQGTVAVGDAVKLTVDDERRERIRRNHSATHLLHLALKTVLGDHATQKGSLVLPDRFRFDFSHGAPLTADEKRRVEDLVNAHVRANLDAETEVLPIEEAKRKGAVSMFGEKYGDTVRIVHIGADSLEFCGGTHVRRVGDIGLFKLISEGGVAQGVRRVEGVTGEGALDYLRKLEGELAKAGELLRAAPLEVAGRVEKLQGDLKERAKEISDLQRKLAGGGGRDLLADVREINGVKVLAAKTDVADPKTLREVGDQLRDKLGSGVVVLAGVGDGKVSILAVVTKDLTSRFHAGKIAGAVAEMVGGKGGGRPDMAQAGGTDPSKVPEALEKVYALIAG